MCSDEVYIGMRVIAVAQPGTHNRIEQEIDIGEIGTVRSQQESWIGVEWDIAGEDRHDLDGTCKKGHGWYVYARYLEPYEEDVPELDEEVLDSCASILFEEIL